MEVTDKMLKSYLEQAQDDPMYPIMVAGEAIANVLRHVQTIPDFQSLPYIPLPIEHVYTLQFGLQELTKVLKKDNENAMQL